MFCKYCGGSMPEDTLFCPNCGAKVEKEAEVKATAEPINNPVNNNVPNQSMYYQPPQKGNGGLIVVVIVLVVILLGIGGYFGYKYFIADNNTANGTPTENPPTDPPVDNPPVDNPPTVEKTEVSLGSYKFYIPSDYTVVQEATSVNVASSDKTLAFVIAIMNYKFETVDSNSEALKGSFAENGFTVNGLTTEYAGTKKLLVYDVTKDSDNGRIIIAKLDDNSVMMVVAMQKYGQYQSLYTLVGEIIDSAVGSSSSSSEFNPDDFLKNL